MSETNLSDAGIFEGDNRKSGINLDTNDPEADLDLLREVAVRNAMRASRDVIGDLIEEYPWTDYRYN